MATVDPDVLTLHRCPICRRNLVELSLDLRQDHFNRCKDPIKVFKKLDTKLSKVDVNFTCPVCAVELIVGSERSRHVRDCAQRTNIELYKMMEKVDYEVKQARARERLRERQCV
uniref:TRAF-type domain-containing protein n=3 Tax=Bursaphelenchus xylophilus TaxID=6326 RepID=A0A1I7SNS3_BURXY